MKAPLTFIIALLSCLTSFAQSLSWSGSQWIEMEKDRPFDHFKYFHGQTPDDPKWDDLGMYKLPQFRKEFACKETPAKATAYVCGLGQFEMFLNGKKVGDHFLDPAWTKFDEEVIYVTFDVTDMLAKDNALGIMLGNGFYNIPNARYHKVVGSMGAPKMRLVLEIEYKDGSKERICSDGSWKVSESAIKFSSIYGGENFDASAEQKGWKNAGFDDSAWAKPLIASFDPVMMPQVNDPLTIHSELDPVKVTKNAKGWVFDMGQNYSGIFRISLEGPEGSQVRIMQSEILNDGFADQSSFDGPAWYTYTLAGEGVETWQPQFTYSGQRYFQVEGAVPQGEPNPDNLPVIKSMTGLHTCASSPEVGSFSCSNELFNKIENATRWALRSNLASVMTDCPTREKLGWNEETHLMFPSNEYMIRCINVYRHELHQFKTAQWENGCVPSITPEYVRFEGGFEDSPEWGSFSVILPLYIYRWYGTDEFIKEYYPEMQKYVAYLGSRKNADGLVAYGLRDWISLEGEDSMGVTSHLTYCQALMSIAQCADILGKKEDAKGYRAQWQKAADDFNKAFWNPSKQTYDTDTQCVNAMALWNGVVPDQYKDIVYQNLVRSIEKAGYAVTVGEIGHPYLLSVLHDHGDDELIFRLHTQAEKPGYAYMLRNATALPESWQGGFSQCHFMLGHIVNWFYSALAGIKQADGDIGWKNILIEPKIVGDLDKVDCDFDSPSGMIGSHWYIKDGDKIVLNVTIPQGVKASIVLPSVKTKIRKPGSYVFISKLP